MKQPTCVIADDHEIVCVALAENVAPAAGLEVVARVGDGQAALQACIDLQPDVLLMDVVMPGRDPLAILSDIRAASPHTKLVILTGFCRDSFIELALRAEISGFLLKSERPQALSDALRRIMAGERVLSAAVEARIVEHGAPLRSRLSQLTPREVEVLRYIGHGWDNGKMAGEMSISKRTVERHVARLMTDLAIHDRTHLTRFAYEQGLVG